MSANLWETGNMSPKLWPNNGKILKIQTKIENFIIFPPKLDQRFAPRAAAAGAAAGAAVAEAAAVGVVAAAAGAAVGASAGAAVGVAEAAFNSSILTLLYIQFIL
jgi:hypothetical protein